MEAGSDDGFFVFGVEAVEHHQPVVVACVLVVGQFAGSVLKRELASTDVITDGIEMRQIAVVLLLRHFGTEENVADIHLVVALFDELDDVIAKIGLHNLRHLLGVVQTESHIGKFGHQHVASHEAHLATIARTAVLRVHLGQSGKVRFSLIHAAGKLTQAGFDALYFFARNLGAGGDDLHLDLRRDERQTVGGEF